MPEPVDEVPPRSPFDDEFATAMPAPDPLPPQLPPRLAPPPPSIPTLPARPPLRPPPITGGVPATGGLTRRVRGAQLPNTHTVSLRQGTGEHREMSAHLTPAGGVPSRTFTDGERGFASHHSAKDVYSFLSNFTAGVQRGLDESEPENGSEDPFGPRGR